MSEIYTEADWQSDLDAAGVTDLVAELRLRAARRQAEAGARTEAAKRIVADPFAAAFDGVEE